MREVLRGTGSDGDCYAAGGELPRGALDSFRFSKLVLSDDLREAPMATTLLPEKVADRLNDVKRMQRSHEYVVALEECHGAITPFTDSAC